MLKVRFNSPCCGEVRVKAQDCTVIFNTDTQSYSISYMHCGKLNVTNVDYFNAWKIIDRGSKFMETSLPIKSKRPWGPSLDEVDAVSFKNFLDGHVYLAAYCEG